MMAPFPRVIGACLLGAAAWWASGSVFSGEARAADAAIVVKVNGEAKAMAAPAGMPAGMVRPGMAAPPGMPGGPGAKPGEPAKPDGAQPKPGDAKTDESAPPVQRPTTPPKPADPAELKVKLDANGKVSFNFKGQPWPAVLDWLAEISGKSLDWQELPGDYLNLTTSRPYLLHEARDLINRHLLARGFTLLTQGDTLSVVNCKKLNPALVPRIEADELASRDPYEFVKISFSLVSLLADQAAEEYKPMVSPNGSLKPLRATNRLEAIDAVINLREIYSLIVAEQSGRAAENAPREFELKFARAVDVSEQLHSLLGLDSKAGRGGGMQVPPGMNPEQARMMAMAGQPMQPGMQPGQQPNQGQPGAPKPEVKVSIVVNSRKNSILAIAPADKMAIINQAIKTLDVPSAQGSQLLATAARTQVYRLAAIDPEPLVKTLEEVGNLDPSTKLQVDKKNRAIIAYAPLADHVTIRSLVQKLDGSERKFEVVQLRRLEADYVAGTIEFMMTGEKPKKQESRPRYYMFDFDSRNKTEEDSNKFRVDADVENNRLLLYANTVELEEVRNLLTKLGEIPTEAGNRSTVRNLDLPPGKEGEELVERIRRQWPSMGTNPIVAPPPTKPAEPPKPPPATSPRDKEKMPATPTVKAVPSKTASFIESAETASVAPAQEATRTKISVSTDVKPAGNAADQDTGKKAAKEKTGRADAEPGNPAAGSGGGSKPMYPVAEPKTGAAEKPAAAPEIPPTITFSRSPDGHWIISSPDTQALDRLEELTARMTASSRVDFQVFQLKYAWATSVATILQDVFKEDQDNKRRTPWWYDYEYGSQETEKPRSRLSKRKPLRIISDSDSNSILVQGGDAAQIRKIEELIKIYDRAQPIDAKSARKAETVQLHYSKAKVVAETVKDVYRDLLSSNDKALTGNQDQRRERFIRFSFDDEGGGSQKQPNYKGLLSIGTDELSNTLILSAPAYLLEDVVKMVNDLDEAAKPVAEKVSVVKVGAGVNAEKIEEAVNRLYGSGSAAGRDHKNGQSATSQPKANERSRKRQNRAQENQTRATSESPAN
jgi:type II secretory pathway component GspD/PulD (secretin)